MAKEINITALVSYKVYPAKMGGQKGIALFYRYLSRILPVTLVSTKNNEFPAGDNTKYLPLLGNSRTRYISPFLFPVMKKALQQNNTTHLILEHPYYGWLGYLLKKSCNVKLVIHSHNIESLRFKSTGKWWWRILSRYERWIHRNADINFFITDEDKEYALKHFLLEPAKCHTITYGFELDKPPLSPERMEARKKLQEFHAINSNEVILLFNGTLHYKPNLDAVDLILEQINPLLLAHTGFRYKLVICGKGLPGGYGNLRGYASKNIIYAGFVDDISVYFKGADIFINPVIEGGGIKTKVVEALGYNMNVVTTGSGATGIPALITGGKMQVAADNDWKSFAGLITKTDTSISIPQSFFDHFYWGNITLKAKNILQNN